VERPSCLSMKQKKHIVAKPSAQKNTIWLVATVPNDFFIQHVPSLLLPLPPTATDVFSLFFCPPCLERKEGEKGTEVSSE